ncbi:GTP cyclohydrolase IIa [Halobacteriales archaeon SW_7_71_33]|nr:MAG: GTP cyclohydrolase IIa [Halobacteriales archaeon SW_7_71_33]
MPRTQITLVQIDNYGPWTTTPEPRREVDLQTLQARLYADFAQFVGTRDGYVFYTRFDNMIAVTNGTDRADHARIQESVSNRYPVTVSMSIATDPSPVDALGRATTSLQEAGSAQDGDRTEILRGDPLAGDRRTDRDVQIAHFDVVDATGKYTDRMNAFDTYVRIQESYLALMRHMRQEHETLSFFVGGDNIIAVCPDLDEGAFEATIGHMRETADVELQVGVGSGRSPHDAGIAAKHALEVCRHDGTRVEEATHPVAGD